MRFIPLGCCLALGLVSHAYACLWDRDTVAHEAQGIPEAIDIIAGRFERNPPLYFQMRLDRVLPLLKREPGNLAAYDDAAVACDRLGDDDRAIQLMQQKAKQLAAINDSQDKKEQLYRYEANIGTFYIHRWIHHGANRNEMGDADLASQHIGEALRINPHAHFGRERYQLMVIDWIRNPPPPGKDKLESKGLEGFPTFLTLTISGTAGNNMTPDEREMTRELAMMGMGGQDTLDQFGIGDAVQGLSGLISLGNAWESVDVFHALGMALKIQHRSTIAYLAELRIDELIDHGSRSFFPLPDGVKMTKGLFSYLGSSLDHGREPRLQYLYARLRASAEKWETHRTEFMLERLKQGKHPDTDPDFWNGYKEVPRPPLQTWRDWLDAETLRLVMLSPVFLLIFLLLLLMWRRHRKAVVGIAA